MRKDNLLSLFNLFLSSLAVLNKQLTDWIENNYNASNHSAIGMKPVDRFAMDMSFIEFLPPSCVNDELFYAETTRKVNKDNTFSFKNIRYEPDTNLQNRTITIRFDRNKTDRVIVYYKTERIGPANKLDLVANAKLIRQRSRS